MTERSGEDDVATYFAILPLIDGVKGYDKRKMLVLNLLKYIIIREVQSFGPTSLALAATKFLCAEFSALAKELPQLISDKLHVEAGCGGCDQCKAAARRIVDVAWMGDPNSSPSDESRKAIEQLIETMKGNG